MANYTIKSVNIGTTANDGTGDTLRTAFDSLNDNWTSLGSAIAWDSATFAVALTGNLDVGGTITSSGSIATYYVGDSTTGNTIFSGGSGAGLGSNIITYAEADVNSGLFIFRKDATEIMRMSTALLQPKTATMNIGSATDRFNSAYVNALYLPNNSGITFSTLSNGDRSGLRLNTNDDLLIGNSTWFTSVQLTNNVTAQLDLNVTNDLDVGGDSVTTGFSQASYMVVTDGVTAPSTTTGQAKIYVDSADGDLKIKFGDGTVKTIVTDT